MPQVIKTEYFSEKLIQELVVMAAEDEELENAREATPLPMLVKMFRAFEMACLGALFEVLGGDKHPYYLKEGVSIQDLMDAEGPFLILMTLLGHGVGIWDGSWDQFFTNPKEDIPDVEKALKSSLAYFASDAGGGSIYEELRFSAMYSLGIDPYTGEDLED